MAEIRIGPDDWGAAVADADGPQLVVAGPGCGKTEFLVRRARHLIASGTRPESILVLSFSRRGAAALRRRIADGLERSFTEIPASTFHSLAMRIVEAHGAVGDWPEVPTLLTGPEHTALVAELLAGDDESQWPLPYRSLLGSRPFAEEVADFGLRAAEHLVSPADLREFGRADWRALPGFFERYRRELVSLGRIDYGSLQVEAVRLLEDPAVATRMAEVFDYVLVDEYQDTTIAQARIAEQLASGHRNLTVAGDPYQSIYSFRGAELSNIDRFPSSFPDSDGAPARRLVLTTSFRVPREVLDGATRITAGAGLPGGAGEVEPAPGQGTVESYGFDQQSAEAEWIASEVQRIHLRDGVPLERIGVLVRSKRRFLTELSRALDRRRIPHDRPDTRLVDHAAVRPVLDLAEAAASTDGSALRRVLMGPLTELPLSAAREIEREALRNGWDSALAAVPDIVALIADPGWATDRPAGDGFWHAWRLLPRLNRLAVRDPASGAALASLSQALDRLRDRDDSVTLAGYAALSRSEDYEAEPLISFRPPDEDRVVLTTLHQAKGLEFDVVFIADAREGVLPDLRSRDSLLGTRFLSSGGGGSDGQYLRFRVQEERRLAYTAMCRSSSRVVWTCTLGVGEAGGAPSRFMALAVGDQPVAESPPASVRPTTPQEAEAWLRRSAADPEMPAADRLAAMQVLATSDILPRKIEEFAGILERGTDRGLVGPDPRLSPSQAESYDTCPRRYAFERRLRISDGGSMYAELGGLIHRVLELAERAAVDSGADHGTFDGARQILHNEFEPSMFGGPPWSDSWLMRAEKVLAHLYEFWPGRGPAVGFEAQVEYELDGVPWTGRVDRAERRPDGVHIVDYKTGTKALGVDEAEVALQLGFYALASDHDVVGAEFWYPGIQPGKRKSVAVRRFSMDRLSEVEEAMRTAQQGILGEDWSTRVGEHCDRCPVRIVCPEFPEGVEAFSS